MITRANAFSVMATILVIAVLLISYVPGTDAAEIKEPGGEITLFDKSPVAFDKWYLQDVMRLQKKIDLYKKNPEEARSIIYEEWQAITSLMTRLAITETYRDPVQGYILYPSKTSGKLHVLHCARAARENFLELAEKGVLNDTAISKIYPDISLGSNKAVAEVAETVEYMPVEEKQYIPLNTAIKVLNGILLPKKTLNGYSIYLMPYKFVNLGGYSFSTGLPHVEEAAIISAAHSEDVQEFETAIAHEVGHFLHQQYIGEYSKENKLWQQYLDIRGKQWQNGGWQDSTVENFAEDFRVSCGGNAAVKPYSGAFGMPGPSLKITLTKFFQKLPEKPNDLPLKFSSLFFNPDRDIEIMQLNGFEHTNNLLVGDRRIKARGTFKSNIPGYEAVLYLKGENGYENFWPFKMLSENMFTIDIELPGPGKYSLIVGTKKDKTIVTYQLFKVFGYDFPYNLSELEKSLDCINAEQQTFSNMNGHWAKYCVEYLTGSLTSQWLSGWNLSTGK